jgi:BMFP domain-containing protein YqiC
MIDNKTIEDLSIKIRELAENSPIEDLKNNIHALLRGALTKMELVSREEFDIQTEVLRKTREKLNILEKKLAELEEKAK